MPIHFHTHDTSGVSCRLRAAGQRRRRRRGRPRARLDVRQHLASRTSIPSSPRCNIRRATPDSISRRSTSSPTTGNRCATIYRAFRHRAEDRLAPKSTCTKCPAASTRTSRNKPPVDGRRASLAGDRPHLRGSEPALRRHRQGHAQQQRSWATWRCSFSAMASSRPTWSTSSPARRVSRKRHRHDDGRPRLARGRLAGQSVEGRPRREALSRKRTRSMSPPRRRSWVEK